MEHDWGTLWDSFCSQLRESGEALLEAAPGELDRAEALRYVARLSGSAVNSFLEPKWAEAPQLRFATSRIGGDNPDYRYGNAKLDGRLRYRLRGRLNGATRISFSTFTSAFGSGRPMMPTGALEVGGAGCEQGPDGSFDLNISSEPVDGPRLPMTSETTFLMVRELVTRPGALSADYQLTCLSAAGSPAPMDTQALHDALTDMRRFVGGTVATFLRWTETFRRQPNKILPLPPELDAGGADRTSRYYNGYYDLPDEQHSLRVRFTPPACVYWNVQALDHWLESIDAPGGRSHYNMDMAQLEDDGSVVAIIAPRDPGLPNWIDTASHLHGGLVIRIVSPQDPEAEMSCECDLIHADRLNNELRTAK